MMTLHLCPCGTSRECDGPDQQLLRYISLTQAQAVLPPFLLPWNEDCSQISLMGEDPETSSTCVGQLPGFHVRDAHQRLCWTRRTGNNSPLTRYCCIHPSTHNSIFLGVQTLFLYTLCDVESPPVMVRLQHPAPPPSEGCETKLNRALWQHSKEK